MFLPEAECVRRWLSERVSGRRLRAVHRASPTALEGAHDALIGRPLTGVERMGRTITLRFDAHALDLCPGRRGALFVGRKDRDVPAHWRLAVELDTAALWLVDPGRGSRARVRLDGQPRLCVRTAAPDALSADFDLASLKQVLAGKRRTMGRLLVDEQQIAGISEACADEILHASRVRPSRAVSTLSEDEARALYYAIIEVLQKAVRFGGTSDALCPLIEGAPGRFGGLHSVHGRAGQPCTTCGGVVRRSRVRDVSGFYCPRCQR